MGKLLRFRDKLLLALAFAGDLFEQGRDPFDLVSLAYRNVYGFVPKTYRKSSFSSNVSHLQRTGYIEKVKIKGEPYLRLTSVGKDSLYRDFPLLSFQKKSWDGKWRVVIFDIEEKNRKYRDVLRIKLRELGFGMVQESVWISPHDFIHDLREFLEEHHLGNYVFVMEVKVILAGECLLADKIWRLDQLNNQYKILYDKIVEKKIDRGMAWDLYCDLLFSDPVLPKELLPLPWYGFLIRKILIKV